MKLLLSGSPVSSQIHIAFSRDLLSRVPTLILVPTATMVEHYRHTLVRSGFPLRPSSIQTLAQFLDAWSPAGAAPAPLVQFLLTRALEHQRPEGFRSLSQDPGFLRELTRLFAEASSSRLSDAGKSLYRGPSNDAKRRSLSDVVRLFAEVEAELATRGLAARHARLVSAAPRIAASHDLPPHFMIDGFAKFSEGELTLIGALGQQLRTEGSLTVALPGWFGAERARQRLLADGFDERCEKEDTQLQTKRGRVTFAALNIEREADEIARRILAYVEQGKAFREIGIVLRARSPYGPLLETTLARFGIPVRSYFTDPAARHPAIIFLSTLMKSLLTGWDQATLLAAIRMPISGFGATADGDEFDFALRKLLPDVGLPVLLENSVSSRPRGKSKSTKPDKKLPALPLELLARLETMTLWRRDRLEPVAWVDRLTALVKLIPTPEVIDHADPDHLRMWRSTVTALTAFTDALQSSLETLQHLPGDQLFDLATFWGQVETTLNLEPLRVPDPRRNVVHLLDAYEARQWELPIVFVCGMTERHFPQYHSENPIVGDEVLRRAGLDTAADYEREEQFLFDVATTRATFETVLSYPRFTESGEPTLPSFFLQGHSGEECGLQVRPASVIVTPAIGATSSAITEPELLKQLATAHTTLSPTSIESFLQCSFQFFSNRTLRLRPRPSSPRDRLDLLLQGSILHRALNEWLHRRLLGTTILDQVFEDECTNARVPEGYRKEAVRLELLRHFEAFLEDRQMQLRATSQRGEADFLLPLNEQLTIRGKIDRIDIDDQQRALVIDYKYSAGAKIRERIEDSASGQLVQSGLYLLAATDVLELQPLGMMFCGLKKSVNWDGWHLPAPGLDQVGRACTPQALDDLMQQAKRSALQVHEQVLAGRIEPKPTEPTKCSWCDFRDICRIETIEPCVELHSISAGQSLEGNA